MDDNQEPPPPNPPRGNNLAPRGPSVTTAKLLIRKAARTQERAVRSTEARQARQRIALALERQAEMALALERQAEAVERQEQAWEVHNQDEIAALDYALTLSEESQALILAWLEEQEAR